MINLGPFQFATLPYTGGPWFLKACQLAGISWMQGSIYKPFPRDTGKVLRVSLVRHPCDWLYDVYRHATGEPEEPTGHFIRLSRDQTFENFVLEYLEHPDLTVGELVLDYGADTYIRHEDLPHAFVELCQSLGVAPWVLDQYEFFRSRPYSLAANGKRWNQGLRQLVMERERQLAELFDYC